MERNRVAGLMYVLACIYMPNRLVPVLTGYREQLRNGEGYKAYQDMRRRYNENEFGGKEWHYGDGQYLMGLMFSFCTTTPISIKLEGDIFARPTDELEREVWNMRKEEPCTKVSLRVKLTADQRDAYEQMHKIVEKKMRSFKSDFYLHDMKRFAREMGHKQILWVVGKSHTCFEVLDEEGDAKAWATTDREESKRDFLYGGNDDTYMGSALRVLCGQEDEYYFHDGTVLTKVSREWFVNFHNSYVSRVRQLAMERIEELKNAA